MEAHKRITAFWCNCIQDTGSWAWVCSCSLWCKFWFIVEVQWSRPCACHESTWKSGDTVQCVFNLGIGWRWMVIFLPRPFYPHMTLTFSWSCEFSVAFWVRGQLECDRTRAETRFRLSAERTSPFKSAGASVQSTTGCRGVRISVVKADYTMFRGSVKSTGYPLHSPVSPLLPLPCVTVCHHISAGFYNTFAAMFVLLLWMWNNEFSWDFEFLCRTVLYCVRRPQVLFCRPQQCAVWSIISLR